MEKASDPKKITGANHPAPPPAGRHGALFKAAYDGDIPFVLTYLKEHAGQDIRDELFGETVLHYACYAGMITLVRALLEGKFFDVDVTGTEADTRPIHSAAAGGYFAVVKVLLEKGASVKPTKNGLSPLHSAVSRDRVLVVNTLLAAGCDARAPFNGHLPVEMTSNPRLRDTLYLATGEKPLVSFQLMSDLHLEFFESLADRKQYQFKAAAPYLALLGDIGQTKRSTYEEFLTVQSKRFEKIFIIAGNHEYYNVTQAYEEVLADMRKLCAKFGNVHFLQQDSVVINGVRIIGATLWSDVKEEVKEKVRRALNDYNVIRVRDQAGNLRSITPDDSNAWFKSDLAYIKKEIAAARAVGEEIVVFTHHTPSFQGTSAPEHDNDPINCAFSSNLHSLMGPHLWAFGHTHYSGDQIIESTRVVSNQMGYTFSSMPPDEFNPEKVINVFPGPNTRSKMTPPFSDSKGEQITTAST